MPGESLRLYPLPARRVAGVYEDLQLPLSRPQNALRPYVLINMVSSLDGKVAVEGRASSIGGEVDRCAMRTLRSKVDAVMIGAGTLRAEKLSLDLDGNSLESPPMAVILTKSGNVPLESNLVSMGRQKVLIIGTDGTPGISGGRFDGARGGQGVRVAPDLRGDPDLREALELLRTRFSVERLLVEGGPRLNYSLISRKLVDELFITLAPKLIGGEASNAVTLLDGYPLLPSPTAHPKLLSAYLASDELFLRYAL